MHTQFNFNQDQDLSGCDHAMKFYTPAPATTDRTDSVTRSVTNIPVTKINKHVKRNALRPQEYAVQIFTLGRFSLLTRKDPIRFSGKGQRKSLELLKTLIAFGGRDVGEMRLNEALWPDSDGDVAHTAFAVTLHRLRKYIGSEALLLSDGRLTLNPAQCWVDSWACERLLGNIKNSLNRRPVTQKQIIDQVNELVSRYHGPFLGNEDEQPWFLSYRQRLHSKFLSSIFSVGSYLERNGHCDLAIDLYENGLVIDDLSERSYLKLMQCYCKIGHNSEAVKVYQRCKTLLMAHLGINPSEQTIALYKSLKACA